MGDVLELGDDQWLNRFKSIQLNEWRLIVVGSELHGCMLEDGNCVLVMDILNEVRIWEWIVIFIGRRFRKKTFLF